MNFPFNILQAVTKPFVKPINTRVQAISHVALHTSTLLLLLNKSFLIIEDKNMRFLLVTMLVFSVSAISQEEPSREPAPGVTELTVIKVKANYMGNYMDGIEKTWVASTQIAKDMGKIVDYGVYVGNNNYVYLTVQHESYASMDPSYWSEEETDEFQEKFREIISQEDQTTTAQSYEDIREIVRVEMINQIIFK